MSLYLKPEIRDKNLGHEIFNYALYLAFIDAKNPETAIILTWSLFNKKIEHIMYTIRARED